MANVEKKIERFFSSKQKSQFSIIKPIFFALHLNIYKYLFTKMHDVYVRLVTYSNILVRNRTALLFVELQRTYYFWILL